MFLLRLLWAVVRGVSTRRANLVAENLALRQQLIVLHRKTKRPRLKTKDRVFWLWLARSWSGWRDSLIIVKPAEHHMAGSVEKARSVREIQDRVYDRLS